ncbi:DUF177 domain-containing protein [Herbiconiux sp. CPCC 203407]|uniref:DUF177 domain-containing protein n=1 Tax=Herbiconiux oxytropis TaxID=2970915 RepID=A0AA42BV50_9MICO|nr:DUF177 domain-containing protein [Herbiconiux oxytropis]MCS5722440.1 DUF177 domain-containing protein [Herbiconiux oxytropis]MCS5727627.1 DUF177 domain-containing protein [Herbiconiux oxytropis]
MREHSFDVDVKEKLGEGLVAVQAGEELHVDVRLESVHEGILVSAEVSADADGECGRCLRDITLPVEVEFQELFAYSSDEAFDHEVKDDHVDLESLIRDTVVLSLPFQPVCEPDCPGLDPATGERLAENPAEPAPEPIDPRWSALAGLAHDRDEVSEDTGSESK